MRVSSERRTREDGRSVITFDPTIKWGVYLGEKGTPVKSDRIRAIEELFEGTDCSVYFVEDIIQDQWAPPISATTFPRLSLTCLLAPILTRNMLPFSERNFSMRYIRSVLQWE